MSEIKDRIDAMLGICDYAAASYHHDERMDVDVDVMLGMPEQVEAWAERVHMSPTSRPYYRVPVFVVALWVLGRPIPMPPIK